MKSIDSKQTINKQKRGLLPSFLLYPYPLHRILLQQFIIV